MEGDGEKIRPWAPMAERIGRILLLGILVLVVLGAIRWRMLSTELDRCAWLYHDGRYDEAAQRLEALVGKPLAAIRIRRPAGQLLLLCRAELAAAQGSSEGCEEALRLFEAAKRAGVPARDVDRRVEKIRRFKADLDRQEANHER